MASLQEAPIVSPEPSEKRALRVLLIAGSQRRQTSCLGLDSKADERAAKSTTNV